MTKQIKTSRLSIFFAFSVFRRVGEEKNRENTVAKPAGFGIADSL